MRFDFMARIAPIAFVFLAASCAEVEVHRVGNDGHATGPEGMRFYMPRPYVAVNEPFIVGGKAFLVGGEITPDGKYVLINDIDPSRAQEDHFIRRFLATTGKRIPATSVLAPRSAGGSGSGGEQSAGEASPPPSPPKDESPPATKSEERSGVLDLKVTNDNSAYAVTPMKRYFDIMWLPDFDEQYVVHGEAGLGNASIAMQMGQGWSLQGLEATVDNSAITGRIFGLIDQGTQILSTLGRAQLGLPPVAMGGEQSAGEETPNAAKFTGGTPLTIKVTFVRIAAPGLYPILKPAELKALEAKDTGDVEDRILVPVAPMTNIAFNTYDAVVVEAALASGDSALRLHQLIDLRPGGGGGAGAATAGRTPEFWQSVSQRASQQSGKQVTVNPKSGASELQVTIRNADGSSVPQAERAAAEQTVLEKVDAILAAEAPALNLPPDVVFP